MSQQARQTVAMRDFPGLVTEMDARDLQQGAARVQLNLVCSPGLLEARGGIARLNFEADGEVDPP